MPAIKRTTTPLPTSISVSLFENSLNRNSFGPLAPAISYTLSRREQRLLSLRQLLLERLQFRGGCRPLGEQFHQVYRAAAAKQAHRLSERFRRNLSLSQQL